MQLLWSDEHHPYLALHFNLQASLLQQSSCHNMLSYYSSLCEIVLELLTPALLKVQFVTICGI